MPRWYADPTKITGLIIGLCAIGVYVGGVFVAYAKQQAKIDEHDQAIGELDENLTEQEREAKNYYVQQQLIQQDIGYIKEGQKQILEAIQKRK